MGTRISQPSLIIVLTVLFTSILLPSLAQAGFKQWQQYKNSTSSDKGLIIYYDFMNGKGNILKNIAQDSSVDKKCDGVISNGTWTQGRWKGKSALSFNGQNSGIDCGTSLNVTDKLSIECWIKPENNTNFATIVAKNPNSGKRVFELYRLNSEQIKIFINGNGGYAISKSKAVLNKWTHVVITYDKTLADENIKIYLNGEMDGTGNCGLTLNTNSLPVKIAYWNLGRFKGIIGELAIYNRALTSQEVKKHYESGRQ